MNMYRLMSLFGFIQNTIAYIDVKGELTLDLYPMNWDVLNNVRYKHIVNENGLVHRKARVTQETTAAIRADTTDKGTINTTAQYDCVYQYPNKKQVEALLSDMMNQLTKIFVRTYEYMDKRKTRRNGKRFKIVTPKIDSRFFEQAYNLMNKEYRQFINETAGVSRLASHDPCHHQAEMKEMWRKLLEQSKAILKRAAVRCISDILRVRNRADDTRTKEKVGQLLLQDIKEVRSNQLKLLCDDFSLCYKDLLY